MGIKTKFREITNKHIDNRIIRWASIKEYIQTKKYQSKRTKIKTMIFKGQGIGILFQGESNKNKEQQIRRYVAVVQAKKIQQQIRIDTIVKILEGEKKQLPNFPISENLLKTRDFSAIKHSLYHQWRLQKLSHSQLIVGYKLLTILKKNSKKLQGKCNLLQCYLPEKLKDLSFVNCLQSQHCNITKLIEVFQLHLIFNYVHTLNLIHKMRPHQLKHFLPDGLLFKNFKPKDQGYLTKTCLLNDINFLGTKKVQKIKANYNNIANIFFSRCYGINNQIRQLQDSNYFFYNLLVEEGNTRLTFQQFKQVQDKVFKVLSECTNIESVFKKLNKFYQDRNMDWFDEICLQISKSIIPSKIFHLVIELGENLSTQQFFKSLNLAYERLLTLTSDQFTQCQSLIQSLNQIINLFEKQEYDNIKLKIDQMKKALTICIILDNFNLTFKFHQIIDYLLQIPDEAEKCLNQILENYHINRVKMYQIKLNEKNYDIQQSLELRSLLHDGFKIVNERKIEALIVRKCLDFGKYRELKQFYSQLKLSTLEYDISISEAMLRYLKLQKNILNIEDERKRFQEVINDVQQLKREKLINCKKAMNFYKFIVESKETVNECLDQKQCNQIIFQLYRKSNNLDLPYIRLKKKLARAFDLQIYDFDFCKFMLELAQKIININQQRAQLILEDLKENGNEVIQSEATIIQLRFSKDEAKQNESFTRLLKSSQSADIIQTLLQFHKSQQQQILIPDKIDILSKQMIDSPLENSISVAKFEQEYKKYYKKSLPDDIFLDQLLKNPDEAFFILSKREANQTFELIKSLAQSNIIHSENLLTKYLQSIVGQINIIPLLESDNELIQSITQALVISRHLQIFNKQALFDRNLRKQQIIERLELYELDNIIPELTYFRDINLQDLKLGVFRKKLQSVNLNKYYINSEQQIKSYVKNQIKLIPAIIELDVDLRYHFIIYEEIFGFTTKEKQLVKSFISQCILANPDNVECYDRIYKQIIRKEFQFEIVKKDFEKIAETENVFILCELAKYYYKKEKIIFELYTEKLLGAEKLKERNFWINNSSTDPLVLMAKQQLNGHEGNHKQKQEIY